MTTNDIVEIKHKLLDYQIEHTMNLVRIINTNKTALDASDTGTGKTYSAVAACRILKLRPIIICPKSIMSVWKRVCDYFDVKYYSIVNYELIKRGKIYKSDKKIKADFITVKKDDKDKISYEFNFDKINNKINDKINDKIFIFDEVHKCSNIYSENGNLLIAAKKSNIPILILSATIADYPDKFKLFFYILNFIDPSQVKDMSISYEKYIRVVEKWIERDQKPMVRIHNMLYPDRASRVRIDILGDAFPETQITAIPYTLDKKRTQEIEIEYKKLAVELDLIKNKKDKDNLNPLTLMLRSQQKIEILKIPTFIELANDFIHNRFSIVMFVNFTQTLKTLAEMLKTNSVIYGEQSYEDRMRIIEEFQENKSRIIICNIKAGGIGISLHDIYGGHPRVSIISPTWNSIELTQALGRIHRAGGKSKSLQRIIYIADTVEERIAEKLKLKLKNINSINNGDLDLTNIDFKNIREKI